MITYHPTVTDTEARTELDMLFVNWMDADKMADNRSYENEHYNNEAAMAWEVYEAAKIYHTAERVVIDRDYLLAAVGIPTRDVILSRAIREADDDNRATMPSDYQQWLTTLPEIEQEHDETIVYFLQGTGRM